MEQKLEAHHHGRSSPGACGVHTLLVVVLCLLSVCAFLGRGDLMDPDEGRHAEVAREMLVSGSWFVPTLHGQPYYDKPAPYYWLLAANLSLFGRNALAARLPSAIAALFVLAATGWWARRAYGARVAHLAVSGLATTLFFVAVARHVLVDMTFTALLTGAFTWLGSWTLDAAEKRRSLLPFYGLIGMATLAKGPVAIVLAIILCAILVVRRADVTSAEFMPFKGALIVVVTAAPFYVGAWLHDPDYIRSFLWQHNFIRFTQQVRTHYHEPWYYYFFALPLALLPWTPLVAAGAVRRLRRRETTAADTFCVSWAATVVLFFLGSHTRLITYMLPAFPALACLGATEAARLQNDAAPSWLRSYSLVWIWLLLLAVAGYAIALAWSYPGQRVAVLRSTVYVLALAFLARRAMTADVSAILSTLAATSIALVLWFYGPGGDLRNAQLSMRTPARIIAEELPEGAVVFSYACPGNALAFYAERPVASLDDVAAARRALDGDEPVALLTKPRLLAALDLDPPTRGETVRWRADDTGVLPAFRALVLNRAAALGSAR